MKFLLAFLIIFSGTLMHSQAMTVKKQYSYNEAITRAERFFKDKKLTVFATVDHGAIAKAVTNLLPSTKLYIFADPNVQIALMRDNPVMSLYMPLRLSVYQDMEGNVYYTVPDVTQIAVDEKLSKESVDTLLYLDKLLRELVYY